MFVSQRRNSVKDLVRVALILAALASAIAQSGCESTPIRAFRGARHYAVGTQALDQHETVLAIAELERAADLVPHASEIQNHLGLAYWSDDRPQAARFAFEKAVELDCDNLVARANLERLIRSGQGGVEARAEPANEVDDHDD